MNSPAFRLRLGGELIPTSRQPSRDLRKPFA
jgi:hypothetical protein